MRIRFTLALIIFAPVFYLIGLRTATVQIFRSSRFQVELENFAKFRLKGSQSALSLKVESGMFEREEGGDENDVAGGMRKKREKR